MQPPTAPTKPSLRLATAQRGVARPQGLRCDIGAVEWRPADDGVFADGFD